MVAVPIPRTGPTQLPSVGSAAPASPAASSDWTHYLAAGAVVAGGALMIAGHKKAGVAVAAAGTAFALLEEPAVIESWWKNLPSYLAQAQTFLDEVENYLQEAATQGQRIQSVFRRS